MNRTGSIVVAVLLGFCAVLPPAVGQVTPEKPRIYQGVVKSVDLNTKSFKFTVDEKDFRMWVSDATRFLADGQSVKMEDVLQPGSHVTVTSSGSIAMRVERVVPDLDQDVDSDSQDQVQQSGGNHGSR